MTVPTGIDRLSLRTVKEQLGDERDAVAASELLAGSTDYDSLWCWLFPVGRRLGTKAARQARYRDPWPGTTVGAHVLA